MVPMPKGTTRTQLSLYTVCIFVLIRIYRVTSTVLGRAPCPWSGQGYSVFDDAIMLDD